MRGGDSLNQGVAQMKFWPGRAARVAEIAIGITYLAAALLKAMDMNGFLPQIHAYQIVSSTGSLVFIAVTALALEAALGMCMVLGTPWRRLVYGASAAMIVFFTLVVLYAWQVNGLQECGCFGKIKMTPPQTIGKNLLLLALTGVAWYGLVRHPAAPKLPGGLWRGGVSAGFALVLCLVAVPQLGLSRNGSSPAGGGESGSRPAPGGGPFAGFIIESGTGESFDLSTGDYLVALLSMTCDHCMESVPRLNEFYFDATLPPVVAICLEPEAGSLETFRMFTQPEFPMHSLGDRSLSFFPLLETASSPPRLVFVRDGATVHAWDGDMPDYGELAQALAESGYDEGGKVEAFE